jgi:hypothetical protein
MLQVALPQDVREWPRRKYEDRLNELTSRAPSDDDLYDLFLLIRDIYDIAVEHDLLDPKRTLEIAPLFRTLVQRLEERIAQTGLPTQQPLARRILASILRQLSADLGVALPARVREAISSVPE